MHLAGVIADHSEASQLKTPQALPFHPYAIQASQFKEAEWPALLKDAEAQLEETLALFSPPSSIAAAA